MYKNRIVMDKMYCSWSDVHDIVGTISREINSEGMEIDYVTGIPRGGLVPAVILSHQIDRKYMPFHEAVNQPIVTRKKILVLDDICDSGDTFNKLVTLDFITCSIYKRHSSSYTPAIIGAIIKTDAWIVFPWEKVGSKTLRDGTLKNIDS